TIVATSTTEAEYVAAASCCRQVLWIKNQLLDYRYTDVRSSNTPMDKENPWGKDGTGKDVDSHLYRSMIGSLIYLTASKPDIMFAVCACARHQTITLTTEAEYVAAASCCGQVLWIQNQLRDYGEIPVLSSSPLRYALTVKPNVFVSHIRQFWSTSMIETTDERTHILATVDGIQRTVFESSLRRNLKLRDEDGISSLPDTELFENLTLMGYNISQNQKFTFQKGFNEFSSNIATALICLATNRTYNFSKIIFDGMVKNVHNKISKFLMYPRFLMICLRMSQFGQITHTHQYVGEGSGTPTEPHHTPSPEDDSSYHTTSSMPPPSIPIAPIPPVTQPEVEILKLKDRVKVLEDREGIAATRS
nr:hypothetical protein [Tanacetum cinerariifolium]